MNEGISNVFNIIKNKLFSLHNAIDNEEKIKGESCKWKELTIHQLSMLYSIMYNNYTGTDKDEIFCLPEISKCFLKKGIDIMKLINVY